ncbi:CCAAT/enhancer-binding protein zeta-like [Styela clava]
MGRKSKPQEFTLDEVIKLGGTADDFEALKNLQDGSATKTEKIKGSLKDDEFKSFFKSIGFDKYDEEESDENPPTSSIKKNKKSDQFKSQSKSPIKTKDLKVTGKRESKFKKSNEPEKKRKNDKKTHSAPIQDDQISSTSDKIPLSSQSSLKSKLPADVFKQILEIAAIVPKKSVIKPGGPWYSNDISKVHTNSSALEANDYIVSQLKTIGTNLLDNEAQLYKNRKNKQESGNDMWMKTVISSGTLSDKVAAYTLMLQNAPVHNYWCLDTFLAMLRKKGKREAVIGLEALRDIFLSELLPESKRLRHFHSQPVESLKQVFNDESNNFNAKRVEIQRRVIFWAYEDLLKNSYKQLVDSLGNFFLQDSLDNIKIKGMKITLELLTAKPEQERELLTMLVNKLGDPNHKIASKGLHMLHCLIQEHPVMQGIVVNSVRDLLLRPNIQPKCQYYCICFLSSQILSHDRKDVASNLIQIYLGFFKAAVQKKQVDNKLLSALLTGVNRAYPYANTEDVKIIEELNVLFRTVHVSSFGTTVQALMLLLQVLSSRDELSDRYYNALYSSLYHVELPICTNRHPMYLNLLYRSMKADPSDARVQAFLKRLLQTCTLQHAAYTSAVLVLIAELSKSRPSIRCFLSGNRFKSVSTAGSKKGKIDEDSDEEHFSDADKHDGTQINESSNIENASDKQKTEGNSWTHLHKKNVHHQSTTYDPTHRNPTFANAEKTSLWELHQIRSHFHPTIVKFASEITDIGRNNEPDKYSGDPLQDFTLMRFLDKFVYRNPKARQDKEIGANAGESLFRKRKRTMAETQAVAANTPEFLAKKSYNPEEIFLQRYFAARAAISTHSDKNQNKKSIANEEGSDIEEVSDDEFDKFLSSTEGKAELESQYNFADAASMGPKNKKQKMDMDENSDEDEDGDFEDMGEDDEVDFDDEEPFSESGMTFGNVNDDTDNVPEEDDSAPKQKINKKNRKKSSSAADVEAFDMMLEENTQNKFNSSGSGAIRNSDRSSVKQLNWERKKEMKEIVARKRAQKKGGGFSNRNNKGNKFDSRKNKRFSQKKNFQKGRKSYTRR